MMKKLSYCVGLYLLAGTSLAFADMNASNDSNVPNSGFFAGLGGGYNSFNVNQNLYASGVSDVYDGVTKVASGEAGGPANPFNDTQTTLAPLVQFGYFQHFTSDWLWGAKFFYQYLNTTSTNKAIDVPQFGSFTYTNDAPAPFTGHVTIASTQTTVNHELALMPFIGRSFQHAYIYFGAGPVLFNVQSNVYNATGFAEINDAHYDITGGSSSFSNSDWIVGGGAQIGLSYYIDPTWFVDVNYTYAVAEFTDNNSGPFTGSSSDGTTTYDTVGTLYVNNKQLVTVQGVMLTINKLFPGI